MMNKNRNLILLMVILFFTLNDAHSTERVQLKISDKITANAEFYQGEAGKPSIIILHGFLLTHNFYTVKRLAESLHESGYTVLTPTLSLGINKRKKSMACEAIHTHSAEKDIDELDLWVKWLEKKSTDEIILFGHSTGSILMLSYLSDNPSGRIDQVIFLSMPHFGPSPSSNETAALAETAEKLIKEGNTSLYEFGLSYCKIYTTTAENFLSYYQLSQEAIFNAMGKVAINKHLILGSADKRIDRQWNRDLAKLGVNVISIEGANHFFDYEYEFDLLDAVDSILKRVK